MKPAVRYVIEPQNLTSHRLHISVEVDGMEKVGGKLEFVMPVWSPGSYSIHENPRAVRGSEAKTAAGEPLAVTKVAKNRWEVETGSSRAITFSYVIYGHELSSQGLDITGDHIYFNAAHALVYPEGTLEGPFEVTIHPPAGWRVFTELTEIGKNPPQYRAKNFDELVDSPIEIGNPLESTIRPGGIPHRLLFCGTGVDVPMHRVEEDVGKVVESVRKLFGTLPMEHYTFFYHLSDGWDGGLEHATSTSIVMPHHVFRPRKSYEEFLEVTAHEYFHLFNVKRIRPRALGPFDYTRENYTRLLWAMEGMTDYYTDVLLRRSGLFSPRRYLEAVGKTIKKYKETPGRLAQSLEESSFDTWIDLYHPYEDSRNSSVSYYLKGGLVSMCLDLEIRKRSNHAKSLDDVMRHLWKEFASKGVGIEEGSYGSEAERATGVELKDLFRGYVSGKVEVDFAAHLSHAGLDLVGEEKPEEKDEESALPAYLGVETENAEGSPKVKVVLDGSPAQRAGLSPGDVLVAFNGMRVTAGSLSDVVKRFEPGESVDLSFFRKSRLTSLNATLGKAPPAKWLLKPKASPTEGEKKLFESWLECKWDDIAK